MSRWPQEQQENYQNYVEDWEITEPVAHSIWLFVGVRDTWEHLKYTRVRQYILYIKVRGRKKYSFDTFTLWKETILGIHQNLILQITQMGDSKRGEDDLLHIFSLMSAILCTLRKLHLENVITLWQNFSLSKANQLAGSGNRSRTLYIHERDS